MDPRHAVLVAVEKEGTRVLTGRTLLQKKLYFASLLVRQDLGFRPYYYGPYSQQVADATDSLVTNRFLEEHIDVFADSNIFGERRRHSYKLTQDAVDVLQSIADDKETAAWRQVLQRINGHPLSADFNGLSVAAKVTTIPKQAHKATVEEITKKAGEYGWRLTEDEIRSVVSFLEHLGLARRQ